MKTVSDIKKEMKDLGFRSQNISDLSEKDQVKERKKIRMRLKYLKPFISYLEGEPTKKFVESELEKAQSKMIAINSRFCPPDNVTGSSIAEFRKSFDAEWDVGKVKTHIKNLKFILKK